jgi:hypothetical protein
MSMQTQKFLLGVYLAAAVATLVFQVGVRSQQCTGASNCALSYGKAAVWSVIWPASWVAYLKAPLSDWLRERGYLPKGAA